MMTPQLNLPAIADAEQRIPIGEGEVYIRKVDEVLHEERESREVLNEIKRNMGSFAFSAQYQQNPLPPDGEMIKWGWFRFYSQRPERAFGDTIVQSWDTASKAGETSDFSVCTTWMVKGNQYYLLDIKREKLLYPDLRRRVIEHARLHSANTVLIENEGSGMSLIDDLCQENAADIVTPIGVLPKGDKLLRLAAQSAKIEAGQVYLAKDASWLNDFREEALQFPKGRHDDQIDSLSQFLNWIERRSGNDWSVEELSL